MTSARRKMVGLASAAAVHTGATALLRRRRHRRGDFRVLVLAYHDVSDGEEEREGVIGARRFRAQLRYLKRHFRIEGLAAAVRLLREPGALRDDCVVLTFDDGYLGNYEAAWPVLREEGVPAAIFVTTGFLDGDELWFDFARRALEEARRLGAGLQTEVRDVLADALGGWPGLSLEHEITQLKYLPRDQHLRVLESLRDAELALPEPSKPLRWEHVREMQQGDIEFGCHTVSHPILSTLSPEEQEAEIGAARERILEKTGQAPDHFAVPNGSERDYNEHTLAILRRAGFDTSCSMARGPNRPGCDPLQLQRIGVGSDSNTVLEARLSGLFDAEIRGLPFVRTALAR